MSFAKKSHFLSLSDQYWILRKDEIGTLWWNDVNFFTNEYDRAIGLLLINNSSNLNRNSNSHTPDNTTNGELPKRWVRKDGKKSSSQIVLEAFQKNPRQTKEELELSTNLSRATITRALSDLRSQNKITRIGSNKTGYWQLF